MDSVRRHFMKKVILITITLLLLLPCLAIKSIGVEEGKRVLFISSYNASFPSLPEQIEGIQSVFSQENILFDIEFMDTKRLYTEETYENFYTSLSYKLDQLPAYDIILVGDDNALQFALDYQEELFNNIPIIFFAVNSQERADLASSNSMITGIVEALSIKETIDIATQIHKRADEIIAIVDNTTTGQIGLELFNNLSKDYEGVTFSHINSEDYSYGEISELLGSYNEETILLYLAMFIDKNGLSNSINESAKMLYEATEIPVYLPYSNGVGEGFFGGKVVYHYEQGREAALMAMEVINGANISDLEMIGESPNQYFFDYDLVEEYQINDDLFPEETIFVNQETSFYEMYYKILWTVFGIVVFLVVTIIILLINNRKRRQSETELLSVNTELSSLTEELVAQEEELQNQYDELTESEKELRISKERYQLVFQASAEGLWDYDFETDATYMSGEWHMAYIRHKSMSRWNDIIVEDDKKAYYSILDSVKKGEKSSYECEYRVYNLDNDLCWVHEKGVATYTDDGAIAKLIGSHVDITESREMSEKIKELAYYDVLTGLPNRVTLYNDANDKFTYDGSSVVIFMDLDNFKYVNDTYGHGMGDKILIAMGNRLQTLVDEDTYVYRLGGDEFVLVLNELAHYDLIKSTIIKTQELIAEPFIIDKYTFNITSSIGVSVYPDDGKTIETLLMNADTAMYKAKEHGRNRFRFFEATMNKEIFDRMIIQNNISDALVNGEFTLYYQPIINTQTKKVVGYEALIRWFSKTNGFIAPNRFIKVAEEMGIIVPIGKWVFETACNFAIELNRRSVDKMLVTVNISAVQLIQKDFVESMLEITRRTGIDPKLIGLELTETAVMESVDDNYANLKLLQEEGFSVIIDDFGTGYSSLSYIKELPIDVVKIDKSFIDDVANEENQKNLTEDIILIAHKLGLLVVAEGVEEQEQYDRLKTLNCDKIQGYLFGKPMPRDDAFKMI